ncbi:unnamed protein product [Orchesella dallaii]|uniref:CUB domain-containing protein n=1 Tax=Orchesella dallaii TaxID=48710 RepID=A0ABP1S8K4_9HEXA
MKFCVATFLVSFATILVPILAGELYNLCRGTIGSSGTKISYKLHTYIGKNERCVWIVGINSAETYGLSVERVGSFGGREVTGACVSKVNGEVEVIQYGILDNIGWNKLRTPCYILVITLFSGDNPGDSKGFSMTITAYYGSTPVSSESIKRVFHMNQLLISHPPNGQTNYKDNELSIYIFSTTPGPYNPRRANLVTYIRKKLEGSCLDHLVVYKLRTTNSRSNAWTSNTTRGADKICEESPNKMWANDDMIMVIFKSDGSVTYDGFNLLHANVDL